MIPQNAAHWHLVLNHVPVIGTVIGLLLVFIWLIWTPKPFEPLVLWWFVGLAVLSIPVYLTGEPAEELIEGLGGVSHDAIETHEYWAMWAFTLQLITGGFALGVLVYRYHRNTSGTGIRAALFGLALLTAGTMIYTAGLGGKIHHPETRPGFTPAGEGQEEHEKHNERDETGAAPREAPGSVVLKQKFRLWS